jgi:hypothetical protein
MAGNTMADQCDQWFLYVDGKDPIPVDLERWRWEVLYKDGTGIEQFDAEGRFHPFSDIDRNKPIHYVQMVNDDHAPMRIFWRDDYKLISFTYRPFCLNFGAPDEIYGKIYFLGFQCGREKMMWAIMPDDAIILIDDMDRLKVG